ncbi:glycosyltransferase [Pseudoalteromonas arctica]|uniref:Glycosyltransferase n=1 Tax=Pseudoalteromonas arctica TaxID=394751 RepID=A0A7X9U437_9GAMM|nr:glycosyltransferase [Pseudoalteromonas arctica]NMF47261.1 glycosyltransferase [Pseudoalteromonas arctica]
MKKIIHITNDLQRLGGVQRLLVDLMTLQHNEFKFEVILTKGENEYTDELQALGVDVYHKKNLGLSGIVKRLNKADLVHAHLFPSIYIALLSKAPTIVTEHNPHYRRRDLPLIKVLERFLYKKFKKIVCISEGVRTEFLKTIKINPAKTYVIHNGVNLERFPQKAKLLSLNKQVIKIGMVGRFAPQKDIKTLIKLMTLLNSSFELHLAGDGDLRQEYEAYCKSSSVDNKVIFHGQVNNIPHFLGSLDIYVQSSHWEGFGIAVVEAMAAGLPTFATNVEGLNNIVLADALFEVGDAITLANKIQSLVNNIDVYNQTSEAVVRQAKHFSINNTAIAHSAIYNEVIKDV